VKKHFILYSVLGVMTLAAILFMHTLVQAVFSAPDDTGIYSASVMVPASDIPTAFASVSTTTATITVTTATTTTVAPTTTSVTSTPVPSNYPSRLLIPSLNIDANVQKVGINVKGAMGTPNNFTDVAWYKYGVIPGNIGSAVIDGHVDNGLALAGVFKHLVDIKPGDDIYVVTEAGDKVHFTVTTVDTYNYKFVPVEDIFNNQNGSHLRLITCGGTWVPSGRTYDERLVVTAVLDNN
jgi:sortase (surface protein transpeptidase)